MTDEQITTTANSGLAKGGVSCFVETFVQGSTFVLRLNFSAKNPALRQAAKRCNKFYNQLNEKANFFYFIYLFDYNLFMWSK